MDLKEYLKIFKKNLATFLIVVIIFVAAGFVFQIARERSFKTTLNINITRTGKDQTADYKYDDFYRLQADERFADTVVRWLGSPRIATDIYADAGINSGNLSQFSLSRIFKSQRLSSQLIEIDFVSKDTATAQKISKSVTNIINHEIDKLNKLQQQENWFVAMADEPITSPNVYSNSLVFFVSLLIGIFVGIWAVFVKHYFSK